MAAWVLLTEVDVETRIAVGRAVQLLSTRGTSESLGHLNQLTIQHDVLAVGPLRLEQGAADREADETEEAGTVAKADDPVLKGVVHDFEFDLDDPQVVAVEDGEGLGADEAGDGGEGVLHFAVKGGDAVDERLVEDNVLAIAVDLVADLWRESEEGGGHAGAGDGGLYGLDMNGVGLGQQESGLLEGGPTGLQLELVVELDAVEAVVARVRGRQGKVLHALVVGGFARAQLQLLEGGGIGQDGAAEGEGVVGGRGRGRGLAATGQVVAALAAVAEDVGHVRVGVGVDVHEGVVGGGQAVAGHLGRQLARGRVGRGQLGRRPLARGAHHRGRVAHLAAAQVVGAGVVAARLHRAVAEPAAGRGRAGVEGVQLGRAGLHGFGVVGRRLARDRVSSLGDHEGDGGLAWPGGGEVDVLAACTGTGHLRRSAGGRGLRGAYVALEWAGRVGTFC